MHFQQYSLNIQPVDLGICIITLPFGRMRAHFLLASVSHGPQKWRHISANTVSLDFMLPELLVRLAVKKRPLLVTSELPRLAGE